MVGLNVGPAQSLAATTVTGWSTTVLTAAVGFPVSNAITVKTGTTTVTRSVQLQRRPSTSTTWTTLSSTTTASTGKATIGYTVPAVGTWYYRLYAVPTTTAAGAYTPARTVKAIAGTATSVT
ncbi:hypothetical protein, partial [Intrasporangium mesophilum]